MLEVMFFTMGILFCIALYAKLISTITVRKMVKEAAEIQKSNHKFMKLIKAKFEHASLISNRVQNVGAFVDKYIYEYKVFGLRLNTWRRIPQKIFFFILILGVFSVCESLRVEGMTKTFVGCIQWTSIFVLALAFLNFMSGENSRLEAARNYMVEYLENVCVQRYARQHGKQEEQDEEIIPVEEIKEPKQEDPQIEITPKISEEEERSQQEMRIRAILEEFLA